VSVALQNVEAHRRPGDERRWNGCLGLVSVWMPTAPGAWSDWSSIRLTVTPVTVVGEMLVFRRGDVRFGVPHSLVAACSDSIRAGIEGWIAIPAWYVRSLGLDDAIWL
jgi:hypothetical protein